MPKQNQLVSNEDVLKQQINEIRTKLMISKSKVKEMTTSLRKKLFLRVYEEMGTIYHSATCCWLTPRTIYKWLEEDEDFQKDLEISHKIYVDKLEKAAFDRAIFSRSDTMLIFLLKGNKPSRYGDKFQIDHNGKVTAIVSGPVDLVKLAHEVYKVSKANKGDNDAQEVEGQVAS